MLPTYATAVTDRLTAFWLPVEEAAKGVAVRLLAHSLGTRATGQALAALAGAGAMPPPLERAVLLGGAEFSIDVAASFAGCAFDAGRLLSTQPRARHGAAGLTWQRKALK